MSDHPPRPSLYSLVLILTAYRIHLAGYDNLEDYCKQKGVSADDVCELKQLQ